MILRKKSTVICGMKGSGKSTFADFMAAHCGLKSIVYDTLHEFPHQHNNYDVYRPKDRQSIEELTDFIREYIRGRKQWELLLIDEANRFAPGGGKRLDPILVDLNDIQRHPPYEIGVVWICRRPTQLHPDIVGLANNLVCYLLTGRNDVKYLNDIKMNLGDEVSKLKPYHAITFCEGEIGYIEPITIDDRWKRR